MGKVKIGKYCYFIAEILTNVLRKYLLSGSLPNIFFGSNLSLSLIGCYGNLKAKSEKKKSTLQKLYKKAELCRNIRSISLYKIFFFYFILFFFLLLHVYFGYYGNLNFP